LRIAALRQEHLNAGMQMVRAGALDDPSVYAPQMMVYAKRRHAWVQHDERLPAFDMMPPTGG